MIRRHSSIAALIPFLGMTLVLPLAGCRGKSAPRANPLDAAIVPKADFILRCDVKSLRETPIGKKIRQIKDENEKVNPVPAGRAEQQAQIEKATGLKGEDINFVLISANLSGIDFKGNPGPAVMNKVPAVLAIGLAKPLSLDQLRAGAKTLGENKPGAVTEVTLDGTTALAMKSSQEGEPPVYAATSADKTTLYVALNEASLTDTLIRHHQDKPAGLSAAMTAAENRLPSDSQFKTTFIVPDAVRQAIREQIAGGAKEANPIAGMFMGVIKPFEDLQSLSIHAHLATDADVTFSVELANAQQAAKVALILPLLQGFIPKSQAEGMPDISKALSVTNDGPVVSLNLHLTEKDLTAPGTERNVPGPDTVATPGDETGVTVTGPAEPVSPTVVEITPETTVVAPPADTPPAVTAVAEAPLLPKDDPAWRAAEKKLKFSGAVKDKGGKWTAFVNNELVEVGALVTVRHEQTIYRWKVRTISRDGVAFDPLDSRSQK